MKKLITILSVFMIVLTAVPSIAARLKVVVTNIRVTGQQNRDEMQTTLQTLLASRLNGSNIAAVETTAEADIVVNGAYVAIGKKFSIDATVKNAAGKIVTKVFVQGDTEDDVIPAVGLLAKKLIADIAEIYSGELTTAETAGAKAAAPSPAAGGVSGRGQHETNGAFDWESKRLTGAAHLMATGKNLPDGSREIFLADDRHIAFYRQGTDMTLVSEVKLGEGYKIISLDTLEVANNSLDIYVTAIHSGDLASQVWQVKGNQLMQVATGLPYYFRTTGVAGGQKKLYVQTMGREDDYYGAVTEATRSGSHVALKSPITMPRFGSIYNFNQFRDQEGQIFTLVITPDGYLLVYNQDLKELWRSNDKFGGSELFFQRDDDSQVRVTGNTYRLIFMEQRILVSSKGDIFVAKNDGFWVLGNARSYNKGAVYCLSWNGSLLEEKWHTRETQKYMSDYFYDAERNELLILQVVQRPEITGRGASLLSSKKLK